MIKRLIKIFILFLLFIFFLSCSKERDNQIKHYPIPQAVKDWFFYKQGTYWIYQQKSTTNFDSLIIDSAYIIEKYIPGEGHGADPFYYEDMRIYFKQNVLNLSYDEAGGYGGVLVRNYTDSTYYPIFDYARNFVGIVDGFTNSSGHRIGTTEVLNYYDSYQIADTIFQNVLVVQVKDFIKNITTNFYLAKRIGTIQFQIIQNNDTVNWILNKRHIIN